MHAARARMMHSIEWYTFRGLLRNSHNGSIWMSHNLSLGSIQKHSRTILYLIYQLKNVSSVHFIQFYCFHSFLRLLIQSFIRYSAFHFVIHSFLPSCPHCFIPFAVSFSLSIFLHSFTCNCSTLLPSLLLSISMI